MALPLEGQNKGGKRENGTKRKASEECMYGVRSPRLSLPEGRGLKPDYNRFILQGTLVESVYKGAWHKTDCVPAAYIS